MISTKSIEKNQGNKRGRSAGGQKVKKGKTA